MWKWPDNVLSSSACTVMESSDGFILNKLDGSTEDESNSFHKEHRNENCTVLDTSFISLMTNTEADANVYGKVKNSESCRAKDETLDIGCSSAEHTGSASEIIEDGSICTRKSVSKSLGGNLVESNINQNDCSAIPYQSGENMDFKRKDCVEQESRSCVSNAVTNQALDCASGKTCMNMLSECDNLSSHHDKDKINQDTLSCPVDKSNYEAKTIIDLLNSNNVAREETEKESTDGDSKVTYDEKNTEKEIFSVEPSIKEKHENIEDLTANCRPKRKKSGHISYDESEIWDSESLFNPTTTCSDLTKQHKKKTKLKESNQRVRIIHSDSHFVEIFKNLYKLQRNGSYCDVKICANDGHILAHSVVIIAASPFLHKKFKQILNTKSDRKSVKDMIFQNIPVWALEKIVAFLYTGSLEVVEKDTAELSKHCKALGLNEVHKKLISKSCPSDLEADGNVSKVRSGKFVKKGSQNDFELNANIENVEGKYRKRKLKAEKIDENTSKISKRSNELVKGNVKDEKNAFMEVERSKTTFELVDNIETTHEENSVADVVCNSNNEKIVTHDKGVDEEWRAEYNESGDDTDSYYEAESLSIKKNKYKKKKFKKKNPKIKVKPAQKKAKETKAKCGNKKIASGTKETVIEDRNVIENEEKMFTASEGENDMTLVESNEKLPVMVEAGNGGECDKCGKSFYFQYELTGHKNRCTGKNNRQRRKCVTCHMSFDSTKEYLDHRNSDERCIALRQEKLVLRKQKRFEMRRKFCCCVCPRKFRRLADQIEHEFLAHEIQYDKEKWPDLYCEYCNYWSMNPWKLHHHKLVSCNKGQEPICDMCGNSYKNEKTLKKHKELMHTDVQPMLTCEECGKTLKGKKGLKHHIRLRHRGENLHNLMMCHICSQTYRTSSDLTFHLYRVHDQPLPEGFTVYRCDKCDYCHNNKRFYEKHMFLHEDKREWHCEICSKAFKTKNSLNTHMIVHTSSRIPCPFDDCTYKALKNCHLKNHIENQHTQKGEKHEKCHLCDYATFFRGNLIKHQRSVHKLEVVTRHSVEMKAKYKNLKSGQIVGVEKLDRREKKSSRSRSLEGDYNASNIDLGSSRDLHYPVSSSSDNSMIENQRHFQDKSVPMQPTQNVTDSFMYTLVNAPVMTQQSNFQANSNMYRFPAIDFSVYNQNSTMDQI